MALTVNTMINDGGGKKRPEANEAVAIKKNAQTGAISSGYSNVNPYIAPAAPEAPPSAPSAPTAPSYTGGGGVSIAPSAPATPAPEATPYAYNGWKAPTLNPATDQSDYIKELYQMQQDASLKALEDAYNKSVLGLDTRAEKIPEAYYEANRMQQGADARAQQATNEYFAARGLNTGTAGQAQLAQTAVNQQNTAAINQAEADALAAVEADRTALTMDYQAQVREAIANNEMEKAAALYEEALRLDQSITDTALKQAELDYKQYQLERADAEARAQMLASMGDFSGYKALGYTDAEVAAMQAYYDAANAPVYYGSGGGAPTSKMSFATAKQLAESGYVDDAVASVLLANGYPAEYLSTYYKYSPANQVATGSHTYNTYVSNYNSGRYTPEQLASLAKIAKNDGHISAEEYQQLVNQAAKDAGVI